jgi:hypothetical protein
VIELDEPAYSKKNAGSLLPFAHFPLDISAQPGIESAAYLLQVSFLGFLGPCSRDLGPSLADRYVFSCAAGTSKENENEQTGFSGLEKA